MKLASIYIGLNASYVARGMHATEQKIDSLLATLAASFGGYTKYVCSGGWVNGAGNVETDTTLKLEVVLTHGHHLRQLKDLLPTVAGEFLQDCVLLHVTDLAEAEFIQPLHLQARAEQ